MSAKTLLKKVLSNTFSWKNKQKVMDSKEKGIFSPTQKKDNLQITH